MREEIKSLSSGQPSTSQTSSITLLDASADLDDLLQTYLSFLSDEPFEDKETTKQKDVNTPGTDKPMDDNLN